MNKILLIVMLFMVNVHFGQYTINGTLSGLVNNEVFLVNISGDSRKIVDTILTDHTGSFDLELEPSFPVGFYSLVAGRNLMLDLIYNHEDIRFVTTGQGQDLTVQVIESVENMIYYDYLAIKGSNLFRLDLLEPILQQYPREDPFYVEALVNAGLLQEKLIERADQLIEEYPNTIAAHLIRADKPVFAKPELKLDLKKQYILDHYFKDIDFNDTILLYGNILTSKIVRYLSFYQKEGMTQSELEEQLLVGVDTILNKAIINQIVYEFIIDFMLNGFEAIGFEKGMEHLAQHNQLDELCINSIRKAELENKMELIRKLAIGQPAPNFVTIDVNGDTVDLQNISAKNTVLFFWASWCPHCEDMLPQLKVLDAEFERSALQIIAISIDESETDLKAAIEEHKLEWINVGELKGWDGTIIDEYGIAATPTIFLLDENKTIVDKPRNLRELENRLNKE